MSIEIGKGTKVRLTLETLTIGGTVIALSTIMYFTLQADIAEAKELPKPDITRVEYELKDELIRKTILQTQEDIQDIQKTLERIEDRVYGR
jgi:flavodoxin